MTDAVVDASVAFKWVVKELLSEQADALFVDTLGSGGSLVAPPLMPSEIANALYQRGRRGVLSWDEAKQALRRFLTFPIMYRQPVNLYERAFDFAQVHGLRASYDSQYVVLAELLGLEFWTADQRLVVDLAGSAPWVRWICDYPLPTTP